MSCVFCRIDSDGLIKVADFGLSKSTYEKLYFRQDKSEDTKLPIKWLAIECMEDAIFSEKSDVVSKKLSYIATCTTANYFFSIIISNQLNLVIILKCSGHLE